MNEVKSPKKPLLYYYFVVMLLVMLFNFIAMPWISEHQIKDVDYNTFVTMTEQGEVGRVEIQEQSNRILFTSSDEKTVYKTAMVPDDGLVQRLLDAGVSTTGTEIEQTSTLVSILAWVLPIVIFVALGQFMSRKMMEKMGGGNSMMFNMGKSNAKVYVKSAEGIRFSDVAEKIMPQTRALGGSLNDARDVRHDEGYALVHVNHAQIGIQSRKMVVGNLRVSVGGDGKQGGFAHVGEAHQAHVRQKL